MENIKDLALEVQSKGTGGDTILAHINPYEADILKMVGGVDEAIDKTLPDRGKNKGIISITIINEKAV